MPYKKTFTVILLIFAVLFQSSCGLEKMRKREKSGQAHYNLGLSFLTEAMFQPAFVEFQKSLEYNPKDPLTNYALGHIYFLWGSYDDAEIHFKQALDSDPQYSDAHNYLGKIYEKKEKWDAAIKQYEAALSNKQYRSPHLPLYNIGVVELKRNNDEKAIDAFQTLMKRYPDFVQAYVQLGEYYIGKSRLAEAEETLKNGTRAAPFYPPIYFLLAKAYSKNGKNEEAIQELTNVIVRFPNSPSAAEAKKIIEGHEKGLPLF